MARARIQMRAAIPEALGPALCPVLAMIVVVSGALRRYERQVAGLTTTRHREGARCGGSPGVLHPSLVDITDEIPIPILGFFAHGIDAAVKCRPIGPLMHDLEVRRDTYAPVARLPAGRGLAVHPRSDRLPAHAQHLGG